MALRPGLGDRAPMGFCQSLSGFVSPPSLSPERKDVPWGQPDTSWRAAEIEAAKCRIKCLKAQAFKDPGGARDMPLPLPLVPQVSS